MDRYLSVAEMIAIEKAADAAGHTYDKMMAEAGKSLAEEMIKVFGNLENPSALGLVGSGNNGGDTLVALELLLELGWSCSAYLAADRLGDPLAAKFINSGGRVIRLSEDDNFDQLRWLVMECDVVLDGLLGTGIKLPLRPPIPELLKAVRESLDVSETRPKVVAVDCPSGIDCDNGDAAGECIPADLTVCMAAVKQGLLKLPAYGFLGDLVVGEIGLPDDLKEMSSITRFVLDQEYVESVMPERPLDGYKGTFGTALIIAGSIRLPGAALMAGKSAFRVGAGWVNIAVHEKIQPYLIGHFPEATWLPLPGDLYGLVGESADVVHDSLSKETAILIGPGFGMGEGAKAFIEKFLSKNLPPLVVDADGLKLMAGTPNWWEKIPRKTILTPHPGEMSVLTGLHISEIQHKRLRTAENFSKRWGHIVVLKGAFTVVAEPGGNTVILPVATPALARAGTGDVLAGIIAGLLAQGMDPFEAAAAGVWLHAQAGLAAAEFYGSTAGVLAGDLIEMLPYLLPH
jgi:NAD(P)H-hydrate epimerase